MYREDWESWSWWQPAEESTSVPPPINLTASVVVAASHESGDVSAPTVENSPDPNFWASDVGLVLSAGIGMTAGACLVGGYL